MKKSLMLFVMMVVMAATTFAQKGESTLGVNLAYNTEEENTGIGIKYTYALENRFRIAPSFNYFFENNDLSIFDVNFDLQYLFPLENNLVMYPLLGFNYTNLDYKDDDSDDGFGINIGVGIQFPIASQINFSTEVKRSVLFSARDQQGVYFNLSYRF